MPNLIGYNHQNFLVSKTSKSLLVVNVLLALIYFFAIAFLFPIGKSFLFYILIATEIFHIWQALGFWYTIRDTNYFSPRVARYTPPVDVFVTVCGEPLNVIEETVRAALAMDYPDFKVYILNDGFVAKQENWREVDALAKRLQVRCITRKIPGGAKSGNINYGLRLTKAPFFAIFDADHAPHQDFLQKIMPYAFDQKVAFVQSPQFYRNYQTNYITSGAWEQQELFFAPILKGKNRMNSVFMCGTNVVVRREAVLEVGGMNENTITEDFMTSLLLHQKGWKSVYVPEVLAEGLAPEDFFSYNKQQYRWARGNLEVFFRKNPLLIRGLTWRQRFQYLQSASYYFSGLVVLINALFPLIFFVTGWTPFTASTMVLAAVFLPYIFLTIYTLSVATNFSYTYRAIAFSMGLFWVHIQALFATIFGIKQNFTVTSKSALQGNFLNMVIPHISYLFLTVVGAGFAIIRMGFNPAVINNIAWALLDSVIFTVFIVAALPEQKFALRPGRSRKEVSSSSRARVPN